MCVSFGSGRRRPDQLRGVTPTSVRDELNARVTIASVSH